MDLAPEELQFLGISDVLRESVAIPKRSPRTFYLVTLIFIFPLSFAILTHSLFIHPLLDSLQYPSVYPAQNYHERALLLIFQFCYLLFLFAFSLLSTAAVIFTVASLYASKPVSFDSTHVAIPKVFNRLFVTFLGAALLMVGYNIMFLAFVLLLLFAIDTQNGALLLFSLVVIFALFLVVHVYVAALWQMASVVTVHEPVLGFAAMRKSYVLLKGRTRMAAILAFGYLVICGVIIGIFSEVVVHGGDSHGVIGRIVVGSFLVGVLVIASMVGLLVQSLFYYLCKSYHHQMIDKTALHHHLDGYLAEYVPLNSSIQMENI